ncbi:hypothetical protein [Pedobacter duraquae]|uniref:Glycine zipper domain-containing protein n=1 Tax=Pedobacter duraquae TaxID=425511 RepID=A0A4R6IR15_9SPHI|nr:hypothetical protein [Pedobacter duraquae]TDO24809.1 hypothetical protein CLV32_1102 [Pedobacter duraquae]
MNRYKKHIRLYRAEDTMSIITGALSGTTGGTLLGSSFGVIGGILGGIIGAFFTGYSEYKDIHKRRSIIRIAQVNP